MQPFLMLRWRSVRGTAPTQCVMAHTPPCWHPWQRPPHLCQAPAGHRDEAQDERHLVAQRADVIVAEPVGSPLPAAGLDTHGVWRGRHCERRDFKPCTHTPSGDHGRAAATHGAFATTQTQPCARVLSPGPQPGEGGMARRAAGLLGIIQAHAADGACSQTLATNLNQGGQGFTGSRGGACGASVCDLASRAHERV